ncbi:LacI family DNA-binding transcriptional regulator [Candidatus Pelagibacter bacterium]|jgi:LacI family transcriptional regulator|nr:LacI family DNA-binding transcriptional regulator [Candidatus Pelagibacter bacterium]MDB2698276.1 LacI family DNA-binding transcriptional regulator [Candidatus Pelagibacter bacterium]
MVSYWKNVSIKKISEASGYGTATVDRVLNDRPGVSKRTKDKILKTLNNLQNTSQKNNKKNILVCSQSGPSYNKTLEETIERVNSKNHNKFNLIKKFIAAKDFKPDHFIKILNDTSKFDAVIIVSQEDQNINNEIIKITNEGKPVVTLTTDLPNSNRTCYIGSNQSNAGSTAAQIIGKHVGKKTGSILMVMSMPYRCQQERELGFRKILRSEFPNLIIKESIFNLDTPEESYKYVKKYIKENGTPLGIYNIAGGNLGVAKAISEMDLQQDIIFVGHELNKNSRNLLENNTMDFVIGHDVELEIENAFEKILNFNSEVENKTFYYSDILIFNKYNCMNKIVF